MLELDNRSSRGLSEGGVSLVGGEGVVVKRNVFVMGSVHVFIFFQMV